MLSQNVRISLNFSDEQIKFLDSLSRKCKHNGGIRLSRSCIMRCLIKIVSELEFDFTDFAKVKRK
ncbi:hypothetical protein AUJ66_08810 [Candidatus Desantisbacteria bacterium CG1_02_38_46]|uniref:Ribbon-helix-helix protein CopG domain-containing protein n=3 Tax=unclassified Candidatus Desantisiibacteriota TaxID=3106372 RepID=A0A2H9PB90_9BACT|nr:MAG: hypothetical protein AUJ66_08810 [Candidatus Desantisbacteria bacterium CG1_02_38_46]PIU51649.1 MAG: hypothetical protein COS91_03240 [Candidatus Desantisbacteria bacterium CG07_land_8_20_14_0_80_39_15]PIZ15961.1 MAG: hypothetical protein COY51_03780 [Candidatus Desantisbacteria bacterium CG_4_10_14_0_8_um_filter_39_17]